MPLKRGGSTEQSHVVTQITLCTFHTHPPPLPPPKTFYTLSR